MKLVLTNSMAGAGEKFLTVTIAWWTEWRRTVRISGSTFHLLDPVEACHRMGGVIR